MGTKRRVWTDADKRRLAVELADGRLDLLALAVRWGVSYGYMRKVACGDRLPDVCRMVERIIDRRTERVAQAAAVGAVAAVRALTAIVDDPKSRARDVLGAVRIIIDIALSDVRPKHTVRKPEHILTLTDIYPPNPVR